MRNHKDLTAQRRLEAERMNMLMQREPSDQCDTPAAREVSAQDRNILEVDRAVLVDIGVCFTDGDIPDTPEKYTKAYALCAICFYYITGELLCQSFLQMVLSRFR